MSEQKRVTTTACIIIGVGVAMAVLHGLAAADRSAITEQLDRIEQHLSLQQQEDE